ncbi:MAG: energy transducer TonB [Bacteroidota bacterium]
MKQIKTLGLLLFLCFLHPFVSQGSSTDSLTCDQVYDYWNLQYSDRPAFSAFLFQTLPEGQMYWGRSRAYLNGYICKTYNTQYADVEKLRLAQDSSFESLVSIDYIVNSAGKARSVHIHQSISEAFNEALQKIFAELPLFEPGKRNDQAICTKDRVMMVIKVSKGQIQLEEVFTEVNEKAQFPGCEETTKEERMSCSNKKRRNFIKEHLQYPKEAAENNTRGSVSVYFVVDREGNILAPQITKSLAYGCDQEALALIDKMPSWVPAKRDGAAVYSFFTLSLNFRPMPNSNARSRDNTRSRTKSRKRGRW